MALILPKNTALQVQRLHAFAFPLAEVAVAVAAEHPVLLDLLLARLHQARLELYLPSHFSDTRMHPCKPKHVLILRALETAGPKP